MQSSHSAVSNSRPLNHTLSHVSGFQILGQLTGLEHHRLVRHFSMDYTSADVSVPARITILDHSRLRQRALSDT
jgi:hypothetical protein